MRNGAVSREGGVLSVRTAIPRTTLLALGSAVFAVFSALLCAVWFVSVPEQTAAVSSPLSLALFLFTALVSSVYLLAGLAGLGLFGWGTVFFLMRLLLFRKPILEIGPDGILDRASAVSAGFVPWTQVKYVAPASVGSQRYLAIEVREPQEFLGRQNVVKRALIGLNKRYFTSAEVNIPLLGLAISESELLAEILPHLDSPARKRLEKLLPKEQIGKSDSPGETKGRRAVRTSVAIARAFGLFALSLFYWVSASVLFFTGGLVTLIGLGVLERHGFDPVTLTSGLMLVALSVLDFVYFPKLVKKLTGRGPMTPPPGA